ncbi:putative pentatricopeptide repeat-containing protein-like [Capsicum annuum]|nr:putative pentatricopeptide repeat-containing protein-like [Capsicum annuum]
MEVLAGLGWRVDCWGLSRGGRSSSTYLNNIRAGAASFNENDPFFQAAIQRASLRLRESHSPDPLLIDPYVGCLLPYNTPEDMEDQQLHPYCLATKFIDDKLLQTMQSTDGLKQVVLLTDGLDTRPYRLNWPTSTLIFNVCPEKVFRGALQKLQGFNILLTFCVCLFLSLIFGSRRVDKPLLWEYTGYVVLVVVMVSGPAPRLGAGAKVPRGCMSFHVPSDSFDIENILRSKGFSGTRPSIWVFQGLPIVNLESFKDILSIVSNLAMKGCLFLGELPVCLAEIDAGDQSATKKWLDVLFMSYGFRVKMIEYDEVARNLRKDSAKRASGVGASILFVAEHLCFSDDQMETWRTEFQRIEEEGDEEGFEEL